MRPVIGHYRQITFFDLVNLVMFSVSGAMSGNFVSATPPTIYSDLFETLEVFCSWSKNVHMVLHIIIIFLLFIFFSNCELCYFSASWM